MKRILHGKAAVAWMIFGRGLAGLLLALFLLGGIALCLLHGIGRAKVAATQAELRALDRRIPAAEASQIPFGSGASPEIKELWGILWRWKVSFNDQNFWRGTSPVRLVQTVGDASPQLGKQYHSWPDVEAALAPKRSQVEALRALLLAESPERRKHDQVGWAFGGLFTACALADLHAGRLDRLPGWVAATPYQGHRLVWEGLQHDGWTGADLARLAEAHDQFDPVERQERMLLERGKSRSFRRPPPWAEDGVLDFDRLEYFAMEDLDRALTLGLLRDQIADAERMKGGCSYLEMVHRRAKQTVVQLGYDGHFHLVDRKRILDEALDKLCALQAETELARAAIALARYRVAHGVYPAALDALAPGYLRQVPRDPYDGAPLRYRLRSNGTFILSCTGLSPTLFWPERER